MACAGALAAAATLSGTAFAAEPALTPPPPVPIFTWTGAYVGGQAVAAIPINQASGRHVGALAILGLFFDDMFPDTLGKPLFGPAQARGAKMTY